MNITFDFACRDDCLDGMVPSDLRVLVSQRDKLFKENELLLSKIRKVHDIALQHCEYMVFRKVLEIIGNDGMRVIAESNANDQGAGLPGSDESTC